MQPKTAMHSHMPRTICTCSTAFLLTPSTYAAAASAKNQIMKSIGFFGSFFEHKFLQFRRTAVKPAVILPKNPAALQKTANLQGSGINQPINIMSPPRFSLQRPEGNLTMFEPLEKFYLTRWSLHLRVAILLQHSTSHCRNSLPVLQSLY